jgi:hypothetical protein
MIFNTLLIQRVMKKDSTMGNTNRNKKKVMSIFVILMTFNFIVFTLPSSIAGGYFLSELLSTDVGSIILFAIDCLAFTYHGFNIIVLYYLNKKFKKEFKKTFCCIKTSKTTTQTQSGQVYATSSL